MYQTLDSYSNPIKNKLELFIKKNIYLKIMSYICFSLKELQRHVLINSGV
jgi:hypothetical protein